MDTTVFFASNRVLTGAPDDPASYGGAMQPAESGLGMVYGSAFVGGLDLASNNAGTITSIQETALGQFPEAAATDLGDGNRNLLIFIMASITASATPSPVARSTRHGWQRPACRGPRPVSCRSVGRHAATQSAFRCHGRLPGGSEKPRRRPPII